MVEQPTPSSHGDQPPAPGSNEEADAFWHQADQLRPYFKRVAAQILGGQLAGKVDASDLVQQALLKAKERLPQFRGRTLPEWQGWLRAIVQTETLNQLRYWSQEQRTVDREQVLSPAGSGPAAVAAAGPGPEQALGRREQAARLMAAVERLPPEYRQVIQLRHFEQLPHAEVAQRMGKSEQAVRQLWSRALRFLRDHWEADS